MLESDTVENSSCTITCVTLSVSFEGQIYVCLINFKKQNKNKTNLMRRIGCAQKSFLAMLHNNAAVVSV